MLYEDITATQEFGSQAFGAGTWLFRIFGDFDGETASLQYSEDAGSTYRNVDEVSLVSVTTDMTDPAMLIVGAGVPFRLQLTTGGGSPDLKLFAAHAGHAS